jgi:hypothetical protein
MILALVTLMPIVSLSSNLSHYLDNLGGCYIWVLLFFFENIGFYKVI